ncbi:hypothetical protein MTR_2g066190 [Medicago truncatula]|uniref:OTU domain-containing protein n=1 Tax=Medicago truncatula TaxID=3880 RepID=G7IT92_MEDTR|nr:hypothetical protein MTR_2g066190 [Medicago truncatula]
MRHRLVESLLHESVLIPNFRIVNRHQLYHHFLKGKVLVLAKASRSQLPTPTRFPNPIMVPTPDNVFRLVDYMPKFTVQFIENIVDVKCDGNCGFRAIAKFLGLTEESHIMVLRYLTQVMKDHINDYVRVFESEDRYNYILNDLPPLKNSGGVALVDKWLTFSDMDHIVVINRPKFGLKNIAEPAVCIIHFIGSYLAIHPAAVNYRCNRRQLTADEPNR